MVENKYYERKIKYLDLMEGGDRIGGAGFVKTEVKGMEISFLVSVKGLHPTDTYERDVMLQAGDGEYAVGRIALKEGQGQFAYQTVMDYSQLQGIRIVLGGAREICCKWQDGKRGSATGSHIAESGTEQRSAPPAGAVGQREEEEPHKPKKNREIQVIPWDEIKAVEESLERTDKILSKAAERDAGAVPAGEAEARVAAAGKSAPDKPAEKEACGMPAESGETQKEVWAKAAAKEEVKVRETRKVWEKGTKDAAITKRETEPKASGGNITVIGGENPGTEKMASGRGPERRGDKSAQRNTSAYAPGREKKPVRLMEDKWQQIWNIYPHIHPFQDERVYLSISPADFVLLPNEAYRAANNSFLLHGYYNYDHLILAKIEKRGEASYYIGVPGNYYEREKQVAIMFGFESFECGTEPAQPGDFGYYMMRTQL